MDKSNINSVSKLGFGLMRLPEKNGEVDYEHVCRMVDKYMAAGLNYFDTAYVYHSGKSEIAAGSVLSSDIHVKVFFLQQSCLHGV